MLNELFSMMYGRLVVSRLHCELRQSTLDVLSESSVCYFLVGKNGVV